MVRQARAKRNESHEVEMELAKSTTVKSTKITNLVIKKYGECHSYSHYVELRKKILEEVESDNEIENEIADIKLRDIVDKIGIEWKKETAESKNNRNKPGAKRKGKSRMSLETSKPSTSFRNVGRFNSDDDDYDDLSDASSVEIFSKQNNKMMPKNIPKKKERARPSTSFYNTVENNDAEHIYSDDEVYNKISDTNETDNETANAEIVTKIPLKNVKMPPKKGRSSKKVTQLSTKSSTSSNGKLTTKVVDNIVTENENKVTDKNIAENSQNEIIKRKPGRPRKSLSITKTSNILESPSVPTRHSRTRIPLLSKKCSFTSKSPSPDRTNVSQDYTNNTTTKSKNAPQTRSRKKNKQIVNNKSVQNSTRLNNIKQGIIEKIVNCEDETIIDIENLPSNQINGSTSRIPDLFKNMSGSDNELVQLFQSPFNFNTMPKSENSSVDVSRISDLDDIKTPLASIRKNFNKTQRLYKTPVNSAKKNLMSELDNLIMDEFASEDCNLVSSLRVNDYPIAHSTQIIFDENDRSSRNLKSTNAKPGRSNSTPLTILTKNAAEKNITTSKTKDLNLSASPKGTRNLPKVVKSTVVSNKFKINEPLTFRDNENSNQVEDNMNKIFFPDNNQDTAKSSKEENEVARSSDLDPLTCETNCEIDDYFDSTNNSVKNEEMNTSFKSEIDVLKKKVEESDKESVRSNLILPNPVAITYLNDTENQKTNSDSESKNILLDIKSDDELANHSYLNCNPESQEANSNLECKNENNKYGDFENNFCNEHSFSSNSFTEAEFTQYPSVINPSTANVENEEDKHLLTKEISQIGNLSKNDSDDGKSSSSASTYFSSFENKKKNYSNKENNQNSISDGKNENNKSIPEKNNGKTKKKVFSKRKKFAKSSVYSNVYTSSSDNEQENAMNTDKNLEQIDNSEKNDAEVDEQDVTTLQNQLSQVSRMNLFAESESDKDDIVTPIMTNNFKNADAILTPETTSENDKSIINNPTLEMNKGLSTLHQTKLAENNAQDRTSLNKIKTPVKRIRHSSTSSEESNVSSAVKRKKITDENSNTKANQSLDEDGFQNRSSEYEIKLDENLNDSTNTQSSQIEANTEKEMINNNDNENNNKTLDDENNTSQNEEIESLAAKEEDNFEASPHSGKKKTVSEHKFSKVSNHFSVQNGIIIPNLNDEEDRIEEDKCEETGNTENKYEEDKDEEDKVEENKVDKEKEKENKGEEDEDDEEKDVESEIQNRNINQDSEDEQTVSNLQSQLSQVLRLNLLENASSDSESDFDITTIRLLKKFKEESVSSESNLSSPEKSFFVKSPKNVTESKVEENENKVCLESPYEIPNESSKTEKRDKNLELEQQNEENRTQEIQHSNNSETTVNKIKISDILSDHSEKSAKLENTKEKIEITENNKLDAADAVSNDNLQKPDKVNSDDLENEIVPANPSQIEDSQNNLHSEDEQTLLSLRDKLSQVSRLQLFQESESDCENVNVNFISSTIKKKPKVNLTDTSIDSQSEEKSMKKKKNKTFETSSDSKTKAVSEGANYARPILNLAEKIATDSEDDGQLSSADKNRENILKSSNTQIESVMKLKSKKKKKSKKKENVKLTTDCELSSEESADETTLKLKRKNQFNLTTPKPEDNLASASSQAVRHFSNQNRMFISKSNYELIYNYAQKRNLIEEKKNCSFSLADLNEDEEVAILEMPTKMLNINLKGKKLLISKNSLKVGADKYKITRQSIHETLWVSSQVDSENENNYRTTKIRPIDNVIVQRKVDRKKNTEKMLSEFSDSSSANYQSKDKKKKRRFSDIDNSFKVKKMKLNLSSLDLNDSSDNE